MLPNRTAKTIDACMSTIDCMVEFGQYCQHRNLYVCRVDCLHLMIKIPGDRAILPSGIFFVLT